MMIILSMVIIIMIQEHRRRTRLIVPGGAEELCRHIFLVDCQSKHDHTLIPHRGDDNDNDWM